MSTSSGKGLLHALLGLVGVAGSPAPPPVAPALEQATIADMTRGIGPAHPPRQLVEPRTPAARPAASRTDDDDGLDDVLEGLPADIADILRADLGALSLVGERCARDERVFRDVTAALGRAFGVSVPTADGTPEAAPDAGPTPGLMARKAQLAVLRGLFPIVWQIDEAAAHLDSGDPAAASLKALRQSVLGLLSAHGVEELAGKDAPADARRAVRAGFAQRSGRRTEVLVAPRTVVYADRRPDATGLRKAG